MKIPEKLLKLSEKELKETLVDNIFKSEYVIYDGDIVDNIERTKKLLFVDGVRMNYNEFIKECEPLTFEKLNRFRKENVLSTINTWTTTKFFNWVHRQFVDVYGEEFVYYDTYDTIYVHFPELVVRNSVEQSHIIRDVYLRFLLDTRRVTLKGILRGTLTDIEIRNEYVFSHVNTGNIFGWNSTFCFGYTEIADLRSRLESGRNNGRLTIFKELKFFLEALKEYFSWESLEGVPYKKIDDVIYDKKQWREANTSTFDREKALNCVLNNIEEFTYTYDYNDDGNQTIKLSAEAKEKIEAILEQNFPENLLYYLEGMSVEKRNISDISYRNSEHIYFKGEYRPFTLITVENKEELPKKICRGMLRSVINMLEDKFTQFLINKKLNEYNNS